MKKTEKKQNQKGFSLVEMIIVMAIMAIIVAVAIPAFSGLRATANKNTDIATGKTIAVATATWLAQQSAITGADTDIPVTGAGAADSLVESLNQNLEGAALPKPKTNPTGNFVVRYSPAGDITVTNGGDPVVTLYPAP